MDRAGLCVAAAVGIGAVLVSLLGMHHVEEGHVGVYYVGGALQDRVTEPGYHMMTPFISRFVAIPTSFQTDVVTDVPCGTAVGVTVYFEKIEVVYRLRKTAVLSTVRMYTPDFAKTWIHDRIHGEVNQMCSSSSLQSVYIDDFPLLDEMLSERMASVIDKWVPGIEIIAIRVTKPRIPDLIAANYARMEAVRADLLVKTQHQKNVIKEAETNQTRAVMHAQSTASVSVIDSERRVEAMRSKAEVARLDSQMLVDRERSRTDAAFYKLQQEAKTNQALLTPDFLKFKAAQLKYQNTKMFIGNRIPGSIIEEPDDSVTISSDTQQAARRAGQQARQHTTLHALPHGGRSS